MYKVKRVLKFNAIIFFILKLIMLSHLSALHALLDSGTKEFFNGKVIRAAVYHVGLILYLLLFHFNITSPTSILVSTIGNNY